MNFAIAVISAILIAGVTSKAPSRTSTPPVISVTATHAQELLSILSKAYVNVTGASQRLVALEPAFKKLGVASIAKTDVNSLATATNDFCATLVFKAPSSVKLSASALTGKYNSAISFVVAAYASD
ncbi:hypothetical protein A4X09_0g4581 [Tilletia walkeri]|uniref:Dolichyl-diphosphooligosaccharide--protein glycosyltransferase subunit 2 n=1 Tax=Tilletia walkeri TaxID=117179 RepID=A0A8X7N8K2_9BASI|nr:hypothetical protein A4X09_0g4581 [Tilletia walkeri]